MSKKSNSFLPGPFGARSLANLLGFLVAGAVLLAAGGISAQATLKGAGSTFAYPVYSKWFAGYQKKDDTVNFEYGYVGSSEGIRKALAREVDFGATDAVLTDAQLTTSGKDYLHIPTFAGGVVVTFNLPGHPVLNLDGELIADLFLGKVTKWNDERLAKLNPGSVLPDLAVSVIHRSDGSGTTSVFTEYLAKVSSEWREKVGGGKTVKWPTGTAGKGNRGVVELVSATPGAITYAEHAAVADAGLPDAAVKNRAGKFVRANVETIKAALAAGEIPDDFRFSLTDAVGEASYPLASATWLLVSIRGESPTKNRKLVQFLTWALKDGDQIVESKGCAPLPREMKERALARLKRVRVP